MRINVFIIEWLCEGIRNPATPIVIATSVFIDDLLFLLTQIIIHIFTILAHNYKFTETITECNIVLLRSLKSNKEGC